MAAADHGEGIRGIENGSAGDRGHGLLAGVDQIRVQLFRRGERPHAQQAVFRLQHDLHPLRDVIGHQGGDAYAKIDIVAVLQFARHAHRYLFAGQGHGQVVMVRCSMRFSKTPWMSRST